MLKRIYADNYKCLVNFEFHPRSVNLLVGGNGSGKSCVFQVLEAVQDIVVFGEAVEERIPAASLTRWDSRDTQRFEIDVEIDEGMYRYVLEVEQNRKISTASIQREHVDFNGTTLFKYEARQVHLYNDQGKLGTSFPADPRRSFLGILDERPENQRLMRFKNIIASFWVFRLNPARMTAVSKKEAHWLERDGSNLAYWYRNASSEDPEAIGTLNQDMREIFEDLQSFRFVPTAGSAKELVATFASGQGQQGKSYNLSFDELSSGQREIFALYAILRLAARRASVLCFDEPDNFISLREVQPWLGKLSEVVEETRSQLLIISHHPEVIDYLAPGDAFKFERPSGDVARVRPLQIDLDAGLKASEAIARGWDEGQT
ncbi:AAA family ATPase [Chondromyces apiculatus]|uniref:ATPase AAA-type core domain-containing protein n=1 Tax=Chondromyces apiculatus DSM 436 TaxID=1192034 RepID=A0A017TEV2_9BACT|nr:ATP-binding protein [Chondromyces apiculatus]EYF07442.1 Hypothetical protein CAP_0195 [Chondromyces apiculatus DSM 436]